jgi:uncharacterized protein YbaR (Trm112 family)
MPITTLMDADLLKIMCCPETHQKLREAEPALVSRINEQIAAGSLKNRGGEVVREKIIAGLIREDSRFLYPIRQHPIMLINEALPLTS